MVTMEDTPTAIEYDRMLASVLAQLTFEIYLGTTVKGHQFGQQCMFHKVLDVRFYP